MNTTIDAIEKRVVSPAAPTYADAPRLLHLEPAVKPNLLILQPSGSLNQANSHKFQQELESTLEQVTDAVIVDLLWVDSTDADGIAALVAGIQRATVLGKYLSFQSMNVNAQIALETAWAQHQAITVGAWAHTFSSDLEAFPGNFTHGQAPL